MTLREKVIEIMPECINENLKGGVDNCPCDYKFLNTNENDWKCPNEVFFNCETCWDREYKTQ